MMSEQNEIAINANIRLDSNRQGNDFQITVKVQVKLVTFDIPGSSRNPDKLKKVVLNNEYEGVKLALALRFIYDGEKLWFLRFGSIQGIIGPFNIVSTGIY